MNLKRCTAALFALTLGTAWTMTLAQDKGKESIAGKAAAVQAAKPAKAAAKPTAAQLAQRAQPAQPTAAALKASPAPALSKPADSEGAIGSRGGSSHCHSSGSDA